MLYLQLHKLSQECGVVCCQACHLLLTLLSICYLPCHVACINSSNEEEEEELSNP